MIIIGAGAIGLEFGYFYQAFGAKVTIVELEKQMLPGFDAEVAEELRKAFVKRGATVMLGHGYKSMARKGNAMVGHAGRRRRPPRRSRPKRCWSPSAAIRSAATSAWIRSASKPTVAISRLTIRSARAARRIYAIGDVARMPLLAHKASAEGIAAVEIMAGVREPGFDLLAVPGCIYCEPEVATVGLSEEQAKARGIEVKVGKMPFRANGKAVAVNQTEGFVKIVASKKYGEVLGCQIIGHHATDLISEIVLGRDARNDDGRTRPQYPSPSDALGVADGSGARRGGRVDQFLTRRPLCLVSPN